MIAGARRSGMSRKARMRSTGRGFEAVAPVHWTHAHVSPFHGFRNNEVRLQPHACLARDPGVCCAGVGTHAAHKVTTGRDSHRQINPTNGQIVNYRSQYRAGLAPRRPSCYDCRRLGGAIRGIPILTRMTRVCPGGLQWWLTPLKSQTSRRSMHLRCAAH